MQTLTFTMPNNLTQLHDELIASVAGFHRTVGPSDDLAATDDCGSIEASAETIKVTFAGDISAQLEKGATVTAIGQNLTNPGAKFKEPPKQHRARLRKEQSRS